jgi:hypothetical protein
MMCSLKTAADNEELIAPPFTLPEVRTGQPVSTAVYRQRHPVGLLLVSNPDAAHCAVQVAGARLNRFREAGAVLLVVVKQWMPADFPPDLLVLVDSEGSVFERYECPSGSAICLYGLDRYGAVVYRDSCPAEDLSAALLRLLDAIELSEMQCPECGV